MIRRQRLKSSDRHMPHTAAHMRARIDEQAHEIVALRKLVADLTRRVYEAEAGIRQLNDAYSLNGAIHTPKNYRRLL